MAILASLIVLKTKNIKIKPNTTQLSVVQFKW